MRTSFKTWVRRGWVGAAVCMTSVGCGDPLPRVEGDVAFVGVTVIPMTEADVSRRLENQTVVIADRRIASINPTDAVEVGEGVTIIEGSGRYLLPGLAEMHGHLPGPRLLPADAANLLFLYVANGVTTVRGMQGDPSQLRLRDQIARGELVGPRLFLSSPAMSGDAVTTPGQAEQLTREFKQTGYDLVKVHEGLTPEVFDALAATAREVGLPFGGHVPDQVGLWRALDAGQTSIDHLDNYLEALVPETDDQRQASGIMGVGALLDRVDEGRLPRLVQATRTAGAWVVPTMVLWETAFFGDRSAAEVRAGRPEVRYMPPETVLGWERAVDDRLAGSDPVVNRRVSALRRTVFRALHDGGASILLGTDSPQIFSVPGFSLHHEMALWVELGMTPAEVLAAGTSRVAEYFGASEDFGSIAVGRRADLLLLAADPLEDIARVTERVGVMVNGRWMPEAQIQDRLSRIAQFYGN